MELEQPKSNLEQQLAEDAATEAKFEAARELVRKQVKLQKAFREGTLTLAAYKTLPAQLRRMYARTHGVPVTSAEKQAQERAAAKKKKNNKLARKSRKVNRRKGR